MKESIAVIAAAGLSSRMGAFKPLLPFRGKTVVECTVDSALSWGAELVLLVVGHRGAEIAERFSGNSGVEVLFNRDYAESDMFTSMRIGLAFAEKADKAVFLLPGDIPAVGQKTGMKLYTGLQKNRALWARPVYQGRGGHPVLLSPLAVRLVMHYAGKDGLRGALRSLPEPPLELSAGPQIHMDLDTPENYEMLRYWEGENCDAAIWNKTI